MLGVLRVEAIVIGVAIGALAGALLFFVLALLAGATGSETLEGLALTLAVLVGMAAAGLVAGNMARVNGRFHGSVTALVLARYHGGHLPLWWKPDPDPCSALARSDRDRDRRGGRDLRLPPSVQ